MDYIPHIIGLLGVLSFVISYQQKSRKGIIAFSIVARVCFIIQYVLLSAFEGAAQNAIGCVCALMAENKLDGIECFHPSADEEQRAVLEEYARAHTLYISGGSDYHGSKKQGVQLGVGRGDLNISKKYLEEWVEV